MKILISNIFLSFPHGSENWTETIADELVRCGHTVDLFTYGIGGFGEHLQTKGYKIYTGGCPPVDAYDIGLINHGSALSAHVRQMLIGKYIFVSHGTIPEEAPPFTWDKGKHGYLAMTSEVRDHWQPQIQKPIGILNNPICDAYYQTEPLKPKRLHKILWGNHRFEVPSELSELCMTTGIEITSGLYNEPPDAIMHETHKAQLVIGTGRWIYQAMAAGKPCIVADDKRITGYLNELNYPEFVWFNMTTRNPLALEAQPGVWEKLLNEYDYQTGEKLCEISLQNHHVEKVVNRILEFTNEL